MSRLATKALVAVDIVLFAAKPGALLTFLSTLIYKALSKARYSSSS